MLQVFIPHINVNGRYLSLGMTFIESRASNTFGLMIFDCTGKKLKIYKNQKVIYSYLSTF